MARLSAPHKNLIGGQLLGVMRIPPVAINMTQWIYDDYGLSLYCTKTTGDTDFLLMPFFCSMKHYFCEKIIPMRIKYVNMNKKKLNVAL